MKLKNNFSSVRVVLMFLSVWIFTIWMQQGDGGKESIEEFLGKIKESLEKWAKMQKEISSRKKKDAKEKKRVRQKIFEKLTNPYYWLKHKEIKLKKPEELQEGQHIEPQDSSLQKNSQTLYRQINNFLKQHPQLVPFKLSDIKQFFQKSGDGSKRSSNSSTLQQNQASVAFDEEGFSKYKAIKVLLEDTLENLYRFWSMVWLIIKHPVRFDFIRNTICGGEVSENLKEPKEVFVKPPSTQSSIVRRLVGVAAENSYCDFGCEISYILEIEGTLGHYYHSIAKSVVWEKWTGEGRILNFTKSLCYNLSIFALLGRNLYWEKENTSLKAMQSCVEDYEDRRKLDKCQSITELDIIRVYYAFKRYLSLAATIYKKILLPTFKHLCLQKCLCADIAMECDFGGKKKEEGEIKETIAALTYETLYKEILQVSLAMTKMFGKGFVSEREQQLYNYFSDILISNNCENLRADIKSNFEKLTGELVNLIDEVVKKELTSSPTDFQGLTEVKEEIRNGYFLLAFSDLQNKLPKVFFDVIASSGFNVFVSHLRDLINGLKGKIITQKDKCSILLLGYVVSILKDKSVGQDIIQFLMNDTLEGIVFVLAGAEIAFFKENDDPNNIDGILTKLVHLPFAVLQNLSLYKLEKCYDVKNLPQSSEKLKEKYECIFKSENLYIECLFQGGSFLFKNGSILQSVVSKEKATLYNIEQFLASIENKRLSDYSEQFREVCDSDSKKKCYNFIKRYESASDVIKDLCKNNLYQKLKDYCPIPLQECSTTTVAYCYELKNGVFYLQKKEQSNCGQPGQPPCWCSTECKTIYNTLTDWLWFQCCFYNEELAKVGVEIKDACKYLDENISQCCLSIRVFEGNWDKAIESFSNTMRLCETGIFDTKKVLRKLEEQIVKPLGYLFYSIFKSRIKNLKLLWETKENCVER